MNLKILKSIILFIAILSAKSPSQIGMYEPPKPKELTK